MACICIYIYIYIILTFYLAFCLAYTPIFFLEPLLTLFLASFLAFYLASCPASIYAADLPFYLASCLAVYLRHSVWHSTLCGWGQAENTPIRSSWLRSGWELSDLALAGEKNGKTKGRRAGQLTSNLTSLTWGKRPEYYSQLLPKWSLPEHIWYNYNVIYSNSEGSSPRKCGYFNQQEWEFTIKDSNLNKLHLNHLCLNSNVVLSTPTILVGHSLASETNYSFPLPKLGRPPDQGTLSTVRVLVGQDSSPDTMLLTHFFAQTHLVVNCTLLVTLIECLRKKYPQCFGCHHFPFSRFGVLA